MTGSRKCQLLCYLYVECVHNKNCIGLSPERRICFILCLQVFEIVFRFHKMLRDSAFNFVSAMMYVSIMRRSLVFMQASCMQCSPSSSTVAVGCMTGHVYFVEMTDVEKPRLIYRSHLHHGPVLQLRYVCGCGHVI